MPLSASEIENLIRAALPDANVTLHDLAGDDNHFRAEIVSPSFAGLTRIQQHQMVYQALGSKMGNELHALSLKTSDK